MKIDQEQFEATHLLDKDSFITKLCNEIVQEISWVKQAWPPQFIRQMVEYAYDRATIANGFRRDADISMYVYMYFEVCADFDQHPAISRVLHDPALPPEEKWERLSNGEEFEEIWQKLASITNDEDLFPEGKGQIELAYPTTYQLPGFQLLYAKIRREQYSFLSEGESMNAE